MIEHCIYGVDLDPRAVELCKFNLWLEAGEPADLPPILDRRIRCGDSLFLPWHSAFPEVFAAGGFDAVLGNPPFVNAIEGGISPETKKLLAANPGELRGTADLAFHFVQLSHALAKTGGTVGLVLPKTFLNAEAAAALRERLRRERPPSMIHIPRRAVYFPGASAYTCLVVLGGDTTCSISDDESPREATWRRGTISHSNWWRSVQTVLGRIEEMPPGDFVPLGERFEVSASMTAGDAYAIKRLRARRFGRNGPEARHHGPDRSVRVQMGAGGMPLFGLDLRPAADRRRRGLIPLACRPAAQSGDAAETARGGLVQSFRSVFGSPRANISERSPPIRSFIPKTRWKRLRNFARGSIRPTPAPLLRAELGAASVGGGFMTLKKKTLQELPIPDR